MILLGDVRQTLPTLPDRSVQTCITSPPYFGLRDYGCDAQIGLEPTPREFVDTMVQVFREVRRVLRDDGTLWLNLGDSYAGSGRGGYQGGKGTLQGSFEGQNQSRSARKVSDASRKNCPKVIGNRVPATGINASQIEAGVIGRDWVAPPSGFKPKDLMGIPWRVAFALQDDGWYLRQDIIWSKPNPMPESVRDRCTKAHEYLFLLSKSARYYFDADAIAEPRVQDEDANGFRGGAYTGGDVRNDSTGKRKSVGNRRVGQSIPSGWATGTDRAHDELTGRFSQHRKKPNGVGFGHGTDKADRSRDRVADEAERTTRNKRSVWTIPTQPFPEAHFATFPEALVEPCILAGSRPGDTVLDPFLGAGTTALVAEREGRQWIGCELNPDYVAIAERRLRGVQKPLNLEVA